MNKKKPEIILGVDPGSKETGIAILKGSDLIHYGVKTFRNRKSEASLLSEVNSVFEKIIREFSPDTLVIEKPYYAQHETLYYLGRVTQEIKKIGLQSKIEIVEVAPQVVRKELCGAGKSTKLYSAKVVANIYPELNEKLSKSITSRKYWMHSIDAIAVGLYYIRSHN